MNQPQRTRPAPRMRTIAALALLAGLIPLAYVSPAERSLLARFRALNADASPAPDMARHPNLRYADLPGIDPNLLSLDIYAPSAAIKCPVLVMIHGGGWRLGDKANRAVADLKSRHFVGQGYVFVSINYRLSPAVKHPTHVQDVARAIAWVHGNIARYGGDPARISVMGHSAGAHLAALVATDESYLDAEGKSLRILSGVILLDGAGYDLARHINDLGGGRGMRWLYEGAFGSDEAAWRDASPVTHIAPDKGIPPFLVFHAGARITSATLSREFAEALAKAGIAARTVHAADKSHRTINADIGKPGDWVTLTIMGFLAGESPDKPRPGEASASARRLRLVISGAFVITCRTVGESGARCR
ncbi:MAG: alpha/beta hydrolase [Armatimonadota bacterium]|nr:MAG: alpha/beta hydrolase [Armatimonadota bacterium]